MGLTEKIDAQSGVLSGGQVIPPGVVHIQCCSAVFLLPGDLLHPGCARKCPPPSPATSRTWVCLTRSLLHHSSFVDCAAQKRKLSVGIALLGDPAVVLLDEVRVLSDFLVAPPVLAPPFELFACWLATPAVVLLVHSCSLSVL